MYMETHGDAAINHQAPGTHILDERMFESDSSHFSSPLSSPNLGPAFLPLHEPTLGVYFEPADGEKNDVLAALRAVRKVNKQALEVVHSIRPRTRQCLEFTTVLQSQDREIQNWLSVSCNIDPTRTVAIRKLPIFTKLARYIGTLRDVEMELSSPPVSTSRVGSMLRRFSSSTSSGSSSSGKFAERADPRILMVAQRVSTSFASLKICMDSLMEKQAQETAFSADLERIRHELNITRQLCLPDTRLSIRKSIAAWATSSNEPAIFVLLGSKGTGKSTIASTVSCELHRLGLLRSAHFLDLNDASTIRKPTRPPARPRSKSLGASLSSLSRFSNRRNSNPPQDEEMPGTAGSLVAKIIERIKASDGNDNVVVVDNVDTLVYGEGLRLLEVIQASASERKVRLLLTGTTMPNWLHPDNDDKRMETYTLADSRDIENVADVATYVSSRLCFSLSAADQQRLVDAADGIFAEAVRLCDLVEGGGAPERVLDTVLYREMVAKHGDSLKIVLV